MLIAIYVLVKCRPIGLKPMGLRVVELYVAILNFNSFLRGCCFNLQSV